MNRSHIYICMILFKINPKPRGTSKYPPPPAPPSPSKRADQPLTRKKEKGKRKARQLKANNISTHEMSLRLPVGTHAAPVTRNLEDGTFYAGFAPARYINSDGDRLRVLFSFLRTHSKSSPRLAPCLWCFLGLSSMVITNLRSRSSLISLVCRQNMSCSESGTHRLIKTYSGSCVRDEDTVSSNFL